MTDQPNVSKDRLFRTILQLENLEDCYAFFDDICTIKEVTDMAQRLDAAILLAQGKNYQTITKQVGISTATISRVSRCLRYGSGGYRKAIKKIQAEDQQESGCTAAQSAFGYAIAGPEGTIGGR